MPGPFSASSSHSAKVRFRLCQIKSGRAATHHALPSSRLNVKPEIGRTIEMNEGPLLGSAWGAKSGGLWVSLPQQRGRAGADPHQLFGLPQALGRCSHYYYFVGETSGT